MKNIAYSKSAIRTLRRIPANTSRLIRAKIVQYAETPEELANSVVKLQGREGYRLRVGDWRVIFDETGNVLEVLEIGPRGRIYG